MYILVRRDIPQPYASVQIAHAAIAATLAYGNPHRSHPHLVVCAVDNEKALAEEFNRLKDLGIACCGFYENDLHNQLTAVATAPLHGKERKPLRNYQLLR